MTLLETVAAVIILVLGLGLLWIAVPFVLRRLAERRLRQLCQAQKAIVLSFDDGPGPHLTGKLADLMGRHRVVGTFFLLGGKIPDGEEVVQRLLREGHEVGSHSFHHSNAWTVTPWHAAWDLGAGIAAVRASGGQPLYRPPYGKVTFATMLQAWAQGQKFGWWTVDPKDTREPARRTQSQQVLADLEAAGGGVVLLHDFDRDCDPGHGMTHDDYVLSLTEQVIGFAKTNGYRIMPLGDLLRGGAP